MRISIFTILMLLLISSCVSKKKFKALQADHKSAMDIANKQLGECGQKLNELMGQIQVCEQEKLLLKSNLKAKEEQIVDVKEQLLEARTVRDKQMEQVGNLTVMSQSANENMRATLSQLEKKDKYITLLQQAKTKADSINLALSVNLKSVLKEGLDDTDVDVKVDKTVVFVNLSDKMLFQSGSALLTPKANEVLGKIAKILESRSDLEVMVEGYTDNIPIANECIKDNWDLSAKRSTAVVRVLQNVYKIDPNKLIAAGRGQYNALTSNDTETGRSINRRTRIIILPKLDQFYDLLNPNNLPK